VLLPWVLFFEIQGEGRCDETEVSCCFRETQITIRNERCDRDIGDSGLRIKGSCVQGCVQDGGEIAEFVELEVEEEIRVACVEYACPAPVQRIGLDDIMHGFPKTVVTHAVAQIFDARAEGRAE